jgi:hypothetical protein
MKTHFAQVHHDVSQPMIHTLSDQVDGGKMRHAVIRSENIYFSNALKGQLSEHFIQTKMTNKDLDFFRPQWSKISAPRYFMTGKGQYVFHPWN